jgi:hypothetical protein
VELLHDEPTADVARRAARLDRGLRDARAVGAVVAVLDQVDRVAEELPLALFACVKVEDALGLVFANQLDVVGQVEVTPDPEHRDEELVVAASAALAGEDAAIRLRRSQLLRSIAHEACRRSGRRSRGRRGRRAGRDIGRQRPGVAAGRGALVLVGLIQLGDDLRELGRAVLAREHLLGDRIIELAQLVGGEKPVLFDEEDLARARDVLLVARLTALAAAASRPTER